MDDNLSEQLEEDSSDSNVKFKCPNCGDIPRDDVVFLCNTCENSELIIKDGIYMCPSCLGPGENFQCMVCDSKEVSISS